MISKQDHCEVIADVIAYKFRSAFSNYRLKVAVGSYTWEEKELQLPICYHNKNKYSENYKIMMPCHDRNSNNDYEKIVKDAYNKIKKEFEDEDVCKEGYVTISDIETHFTSAIHDMVYVIRVNCKRGIKE